MRTQSPNRHHSPLLLWLMRGVSLCIRHVLKVFILNNEWKSQKVRNCHSGAQRRRQETRRCRVLECASPGFVYLKTIESCCYRRWNQLPLVKDNLKTLSQICPPPNCSAIYFKNLALLPEKFWFCYFCLVIVIAGEETKGHNFRITPSEVPSRLIHL